MAELRGNPPNPLAAAAKSCLDDFEHKRGFPMSNSVNAVRAIAGVSAVAASAIASAEAQDAGGFYGGLAIGMPNSGELDFNGGLYSITGSTPSIFAGYNHAIGDWIVGGEVAYSSKFGIDDQGASAYSNVGIDRMLDIKLKVGRQFGQILAYGTIGYSQGDVALTTFLDGDADVSGTLFGIGVETAVGEKGFLGAEIARRNLDIGGTIFGDDASDYITTNGMTTVSIRMGFRF